MLQGVIAAAVLAAAGAVFMLGHEQVNAAPAPPSDEKAFKSWAEDKPILDFEHGLGADYVGIVPTRQLLRTATDWRSCGGPQFDIPPQELVPEIRKVLKLVEELKARKILREFEAVSNYRNPKLNKCAGGAPKSAHTATFAIDVVPVGAEGVDEAALCEFWFQHGAKWKMGLSKYPSGRIHLDTTSYRSWGSDHTRKTSFCLTFGRKS